MLNAVHQLLVWFNDPDNWRGADGVPHRVAEHLWIWAWVMVVSVAIAVPGGSLLGRSRRSGVFTINVVNIGRAVPTFAVLVLAVIWLGFSNTPVVLALVLLAVPPIFTFTFTGVRQVDAATVDAARGMGMTEPRVLGTVQLPLALPLILNGIRLSSAAVLSTATLAALVASGGLGRYVIDGFANQEYAEVGAGVTLVVVLVLLNELAFAALIRATSRGTRRPRSGARRDVAATS